MSSMSIASYMSPISHHCSSSSSSPIRSSYAFNLSTISSKLVVLRSRTCSKDATMWIYLLLGKLLRNFFTILGSSMISPSEADFEEISDSFPTITSIVSSYCILSLSNSAIRVCSLASLTLSAPTCRVLIAFQIVLALSRSPTCSVKASGIE